MIRDLKFPEDARKVVDALHKSLRYDASIAVLGNACPGIPLPANGPDFSTGFRIGGREEDEAVRREAPGLLSRLAFSSMVSRIDNYGRELLLQRRVIEWFAQSSRKLGPADFWPIWRKVQRESRGGPVKVYSELIVEHPSPELSQRMRWLDGLVSVRNCLTHRLGIVQLEDVKTPGSQIEDVKETDRLKAMWLRLKLFVDGNEVTEFPYHHQGAEDGDGQIKFEEYEREWAVGDTIHITPLDCQAIGMSLSLLGNVVLRDFEAEINALMQSGEGA